MTAKHLLIDLGGTQTRICRGTASAIDPASTRTFQNRNFPGLAPIITAFLEEQPGEVEGLCAGVAGPVQNATAQLTNLDWFIDGAALQAQTGARHVVLINDLQAQGYAFDDLPASAITQIKQGATQSGPRLVLNLGTGCNCAVVHRNGNTLFVPPAESGHSALPDTDIGLRPLFDHLRPDHPHLPVEAILSGPGLSRTHAFLTGEQLPPEKVMAHITQGKAPKTLSLFLRTLGAVAGNFALHHLPTGGLYLSGGLANSIAPHLNRPDFLDPFTARGPYRDIVAAIPIFAIAQDGFALHGCHRYLMQSTKT
ncbi:MAG: glucokinase [Pseudomonadota bacterium]